MALCVPSCMCSLANLRKTEQLVDRIFSLGTGYTVPGIWDLLGKACALIRARFEPAGDMTMLSYTHVILRADKVKIYVRVKDLDVPERTYYDVDLCESCMGDVFTCYVQKDMKVLDQDISLSEYIKKVITDLKTYRRC